MKFQFLQNIFKIGVPPQFYKKSFSFSKSHFQFSNFSVKSNRYQNITKTHQGKIVQNIKFLFVSQSSVIGSKLNFTCQHECMSMLGFQNRAMDIKLLKYHINRDNKTYLKKHHFQWKLVCQFLDHQWICSIEMSLGVVLDPYSKSRLTLHAK